MPGEVWFGALAWSGSWRITVEQDQLDAVRVTGGFNPFDFGYVLKPGEAGDAGLLWRLLRIMDWAELRGCCITTRSPMYFRTRAGKANRCAETAAGDLQLVGGDRISCDEAGQMAMAEKAAALGVDRFVMDDGWFGQRKDDHAGLGDWYVNQEKFPHGLKPLIDKVHALGMDFGLWVEPEMVNPDSDLYRKHPEWVLNFPGRPRSEQRNQLVLNLARPDVRDYVLGFLDKLVRKTTLRF